MKSLYDLLEVAKIKPKKKKEQVDIFNAGQSRNIKKLEKETPHPSHALRSSDSSRYDIVCTKCGKTDKVPGGWGDLVEVCTKERADNG